MRRLVLAASVVLGLGAGARSDEPARERPDAFAQALADLGIGEADLGYRPLGHWARFPGPQTTPYVMPFFVDLFARPLDTYGFARTLGNAVEDLLTPERLLAAPKGDDKAETLFRLGVLLGTERRIGGFRAYSAGLAPKPDAEEPLLGALQTLIERSGGPPAQPAFRDDVRRVPKALQPAIARLVLNLIEARTWIDRGLRRVPQETRDAVFAALPKLLEDTPDGARYYPEIDDCARLVDEHSLHFGCLKALQAVQDARRELGALPPPDEAFLLDLETPWGELSLSNRRDLFPGTWKRSFLLLTWDPPVMFEGPLGATSAQHTLSVALFLPNTGPPGTRAEVDVTQDRAAHTTEVAAGVLGCGIVYSAGDTADRWDTGWWGLGAGLFGMGALVDEGGDDRYRLRAGGMGGAMFGEGLLLDAGGNDTYELAEGDGQGFGGPGGVGVLADRAGNDTYFAEPDAKKAGRADYHSQDKVAANSAQGAGFGRRGDLTDGHSWAGGLGALLDVEGNDTYTAGNFTQGIGYWYGTGVLWDGGGNDAYRSVYFTQGSGAHFAIGALIDEGGDDVHVLGENAGAGLGFGWDAVNTFLIDRGTGKDVYEAKFISTGYAQIRSNAFFLDEGGDDRYVLDVGARGLGDADESPDYEKPGRTSTFKWLLGQVGVFLDLGGTDAYLRRTPDGTTTPDPDAADGKTWRLRARDPASRAGPNVRLGRDVASGRLGFLDPWPAR